jgi:DNA-binding CsgD family transcriptional regulator
VTQGSALETGRAAFAAGEWEAAAAAFAAAGDVAAALDGLGQVRWFQCRIEEGVALREAAYAAYLRESDEPAAAGCALWLAVEYLSARGAEAVANGWFLRAERLLEGRPACPAHVELEIARARRSGDEAHFRTALEVAQSLGSRDLEVRAASVLGEQLVRTGRIEEGMALLDEAMAAVLGGELSDPWAMGGAACQLLAACDGAADWPRATQWCEEVVPYIERRGYVPLWAWCRSLYGGVLTATGEWERAEAELLESLRTYGGPGAAMAAYPLARLAELRMRQGRFEEAERLVEGIEDHPRAAAVGIAVLLARGRAEAAASAAERRLARLGAGHPAGADLLPLLIAAREALGDTEGARAAIAQVAELARQLRRTDLTAAAEVASARLGDGAEAAHLETALAIYERLGMPLERERARLALARRLEPQAAVEEARRALRVFERLGARADADDAAALLREHGAVGRTGPRLGEDLTQREQEVLALLGEGLSNAQIAERLVISPKTAEHHVSRILRKLDLKRRSEAAAYAARSGGTF